MIESSSGESDCRAVDPAVPAPAAPEHSRRPAAATPRAIAGEPSPPSGTAAADPGWGGEPGEVLAVVRAPDPVLSRAGEPVDPADPKVVRLAADLVATMRVSPGCVGLAAPQVGIQARVFVVDVTGHPKARTCHGLLVLCNAEIVEATRWQKGREGCMSVPDLTGDVKRAGHLVVRGQVPGSAREVTLTTDAFEARALQHEIDHCAGLLFLDRVPGPAAIFARKVYQ